jgi:hypothetical protein
MVQMQYLAWERRQNVPAAGSGGCEAFCLAKAVIRDDHGEKQASINHQQPMAIMASIGRVALPVTCYGPTPEL